jgi:hypothetical protein
MIIIFKNGMSLKKQVINLTQIWRLANKAI